MIVNPHELFFSLDKIKTKIKKILSLSEKVLTTKDWIAFNKKFSFEFLASALMIKDFFPRKSLR